MAADVSAPLQCRHERIKTSVGCNLESQRCQEIPRFIELHENCRSGTIPVFSFLWVIAEVRIIPQPTLSAIPIPSTHACIMLYNGIAEGYFSSESCVTPLHPALIGTKPSRLTFLASAVPNETSRCSQTVARPSTNSAQPDLASEQCRRQGGLSVLSSILYENILENNDPPSQTAVPH